MSLKDLPVRPRDVVLYEAVSVSDEAIPEVSESTHNAKESKHEKGRKKELDKDQEAKEAKRRASKLSSLSAQLVSHGFTKRSLRLDALSNSEQVHVSNIITDLLSASASKVSALEDTNVRLKTLQYEHERLLKSVDKQERSMARMEMDVQTAKAQASHAERRQIEEENKTKILREDAAKGRKALDNLKVAATQEAKRAQIKLDKVLSQLSRQVPIVPPTFELMNPVPPGHIAPVAAGPIPLIEASLSDLSSLRQSLQEEIDAFRHVAVSTANALREALAAANGEDPPPRLLTEEFYAVDRTSKQIKQMASWTAHPSIADARLKSLVSDVRAALTAGVTVSDNSATSTEAAEMAEEAERFQRAKESEIADLRDKVKDLEVELQIAAAKNEEANKVVEQMAKLSVQGSVPSTTDFEDARLREELVRQKRLMDAEREAQRARDAQLNEERLALEAERAAFEANKESTIAAAVSSAMEKNAAQPSPASPPQSPKHRHNPPSPSPLSPHKKTPTKHVALGPRKRAPRTPLSRLVLERAVLERDRARKVSGSRVPSRNVLGDSGKGNLGEKGKERESEGGDKGKGRDETSQPPQQPLRKSSLFASTAASAARAKGEKVLVRSSTSTSSKPAGRAWR